MCTLRSLFFVFSIYSIMFTQQIFAQVVISEVYGGGGNSGSIWKNDFIELYNSADFSVSLDGWSVQYISATGTGTWKVTNLTDSIASHGFYLIQETAGSGGTTDLPTPDASGSLAIAATAGKVALCNTTTALTGANPASTEIIDLVGFGTTANFYEGSSPAPAPSNTHSIERKASATSTAVTMGSGGTEEFFGNGFDSNDNSSDFLTREPQPQNSASQTESLLADSTLPVIDSPPAVTALTDTSFTISWTTLAPGHSCLSFGTTPVFDDSITTSSSALVISHVLTVPGRKAGRLYYFRAASANGIGTSFSATYPVVTTSSQSSGQIDVYFNYSVDGTLGLQPAANGNVDLQAKLLERISHAAKSIDLALYSFDDFNSYVEVVANRVADSLIAAKNRGVAVRMVFDGKQTSSSLEKLITAGIPVQKRNLTNNDGIMHNKFFIFDGCDTMSAVDDWVISGSWNVTDIGTYLDAQNAIFIQDQSLARIYTLEFEEMFGSSSETADSGLARFGPTKQDNTPHYTIIKGTKVEVYFSPSDHTTSRIIQELSTANSNIFFGLLAFTRDDIREQLIASKNAGVVVRGMIDQQPSELSTLQSAGVDAMQAGHSVVTGFFHHKYSIVDPFIDASDPLVITGSHNWSTAAEVDNDENTLIIHSGIIARQYMQEFSERYKESGGSGTIIGVEEHKSDMPTSYELSQNYPNPFNPVTNINYQLPSAGRINLKVYDILGREVAILVDEIKPAGKYSVRWEASYFSSGVYFYRLQSGRFVDTKKLILMR